VAVRSPALAKPTRPKLHAEQAAAPGRATGLPTLRMPVFPNRSLPPRPAVDFPERIQ